jgi:CheY-like chemotaxis protein/nitrogen-specific signal transduction histidine kinase
MRRSLIEQREARLQAEDQRRSVEASFLVAQVANRAKDEFLMTLSHELRTPLTSILGWARLLPSIPKDEAMFEEAIAAIRRSAQLQARLIDDVLDVSRVISGKLRLTREPLEVVSLLRSAADAVRPMAEAKAITITLDLEPDLGMIVADATRLHQVIWNLLTNAVKFTPNGGAVTISASRPPSGIEIRVRDTGEGIDPEFLPYVFEPFRQAENPRTRVHGGLGLGLSIVRYLVEAHGGMVSAESVGRGKGATFTVRLPIAEAAHPHVREAADLVEVSQPAVDARRLAGIRILIVDDDRETREFVRVALRQAGAEVSSCESAREALQRIVTTAPTLLLTDVAMPAMDGYELARNVRAMPSAAGLKIVALTAFPAGMSSAERTGFDAYLTKPIDPAELVEAVARVAGGGRPPVQ